MSVLAMPWVFFLAAIYCLAIGEPPILPAFIAGFSGCVLYVHYFRKRKE